MILLPWLSANRRSSPPSLASVVVDFPIDSSSRAAIMDTVPGSAASLLPAQIQEIGYALTSSVDSCRQHLNALKANDHSTLNPVTVARILTVMVQTHSNLKNGAPLASVNTGWIDKPKGADQPTSWDVQIFAKTVNEMVRRASIGLFLTFCFISSPPTSTGRRWSCSSTSPAFASEIAPVFSC